MLSDPFQEIQLRPALRSQRRDQRLGRAEVEEFRSGGGDAAGGVVVEPENSSEGFEPGSGRVS